MGAVVLHSDSGDVKIRRRLLLGFTVETNTGLTSKCQGLRLNFFGN
jgi:hypothetical protein